MLTEAKRTLLYLLHAPGLAPMLARLYGANTEAVIDRTRENAIFARLSRLGFAPTYHGRFTGGRVEGYLTGFRALEPAEMGDPRLRPLIAATLRQLHSFPIAPPTPTLWSTLESWMSQARALLRTLWPNLQAMALARRALARRA